MDIFLVVWSSLPPKNMQIRLIDESKSPVGMNMSMNGRLSLCVSPFLSYMTKKNSKLSHFQDLELKSIWYTVHSLIVAALIRNYKAVVFVYRNYVN